MLGVIGEAEAEASGLGAAPALVEAGGRASRAEWCGSIEMKAVGSRNTSLSVATPSEGMDNKCWGISNERPYEQCLLL